MANIHFILQAKGGVGKSYAAFLLAQYFQTKAVNTLFVDTDPSNATFAMVHALGVHRIDVTNGDDVDQRKFDELIDLVSSSDESGEPINEVVVDCGSSGFIGFVSYLISTDAISVLCELGHQVIVHSVLVGGRDLGETYGNFKSMAEKLPKADLCLWLNHQLEGPVAYADKKKKINKPITETEFIKKINGRLLGIIDLPERKERLDKADIKDLMASHLTFDEAVKSPDFTIMSRQRLKLVWEQTQQALDATRLFDQSQHPKGA